MFLDTHNSSLTCLGCERENDELGVTHEGARGCHRRQIRCARHPEDTYFLFYTGMDDALDLPPPSGDTRTRTGSSEK